MHHHIHFITINKHTLCTFMTLIHMHLTNNRTWLLTHLHPNLRPIHVTPKHKTKNMTHTTDKHMLPPYLTIAPKKHVIPQCLPLHPTNVQPNIIPSKHSNITPQKHPTNTCLSNIATTIASFPKRINVSIQPTIPLTHNPTNTTKLWWHWHQTRIRQCRLLGRYDCRFVR